MSKTSSQEQFGKTAAFYLTHRTHAQGQSLERMVELAQPRPDWRLLDINLETSTSEPRLLLRQNVPMQGLRHTSAGLEFILARDNVYNVWRLDGDTALRPFGI